MTMQLNGKGLNVTDSHNVTTTLKCHQKLSRCTLHT